MKFNEYKRRALEIQTGPELLRFMKENSEHAPDKEIGEHFNQLVKAESPLPDDGGHWEGF
jgi:hypothetical protein|nr:MAG TPA: hypothetical protein [Caudoviricetes sp.]